MGTSPATDTGSASGLEGSLPPETAPHALAYTEQTRNPYTPGLPVTAPDMFFGRQQELTTLVDRLAAGGHTAVIGPQGIGVSSLLRQVGRLRPTESHLIAYVDLTEPVAQTPRGLAQALWSQWWSQVRPGAVPAIDGLTVLGRVAAQLVAAGHRLVAILDGYEQVLWRPSSFDSAFFAQLEAFIDTGTVTWVTGTQQPLAELHQQAEVDSSLYARFVSQDIGLLGEGDALQLLSHPIERAGLGRPAEEAAYFVDLAGAHPLFLHLAGQYVFEALFAGRYDRAEVEVHFRAAAEPYWQELWLGLPPPARATLAAKGAPAGADRHVRALGRKGLMLGQGRAARPFSRGFAEWSRAMARAGQLSREAVIDPPDPV